MTFSKRDGLLAGVMRFAILGVAILATLPIAAHAMVVNYVPRVSCTPNKVYDASSHTGAPLLIEKAIGTLSGDSAKLGFATCRDEYKNLHYFLREPRPNHRGVCRQYQQEIFPAAAGEMVFYLADDGVTQSVNGWTNTVPTAWRKKYSYDAPWGYALLADGDCPPVSDPRYIAVSHITDGMLKAFDARWRDVTKSREDFDKAFADMHPILGVPTGSEVTLKEMRYIAIGLRIAALGNKLQFTGISCGGHLDGCVADTNLGDHIGFDITENGISFLYLLPTYIP